MHILGIPTMDLEKAFALSFQICELEKSPNIIFIIDNSEIYNTNGEYLVYFRNSKSTIKIYGEEKNIGVNPAINLLMKIAQENFAHLTIFNDDIKIKENFFIKLNEVLNIEMYSFIPVFCPYTTHNINFFDSIKLEDEVWKHTINQMPKREGWALTIRNSVLKDIPPIPDSLKIFCGDDWLWKYTVKDHNMRWGKFNTLIYHEVGGTLKYNPELRALLKSEKKEWNRINNGQGI